MLDKPEITEMRKYIKKLLEDAIQRCREKGKLRNIISEDSQLEADNKIEEITNVR